MVNKEKNQESQDLDDREDKIRERKSIGFFIHHFICHFFERTSDNEDRPQGTFPVLFRIRMIKPS